MIFVDSNVPMYLVGAEHRHKRDGRKGLSARDAVHVAAMESVGSTTIMSFDSDFDGYPGLARLS